MEEQKQPDPRAYSSGLAAFSSIGAVVGSLLLLAMVVFGAIALRGGLLRVFADPGRDLPAIAPGMAIRPLDGMGCVGVAIFASAALIALAMMVCCCKRREPDLAALLRTLLEPIMAALRLIAASIATLAQGIAALITMMTTVIGMLGTLAELLRNLDLSSPDAGPAKDAAAAMADTAVNLLETGVAVATGLKDQVEKESEGIYNAAAGLFRR